MGRHRVDVPLRWSDMDAYGHVNNVQYLRLLEDARVVAFSAHGSDDGGDLLQTGLLVSRHEIEYLLPLVYRAEPVRIDLWVTSLAGASFDLGYEVREPDDARRVYARAASTMVVYDLAADRPRRLTVDERARLREWQDGPVALRRRRSRA